jgi:predicted site-specific integrase-resolvase
MNIREQPVEREGPRELPRAISRRVAALTLGISLRTLDNWRKRGVIRTVTIEGRVLVPLSEIERLLAT